MNPTPPDRSIEFIRLRDGTPAITRPIRPEDDAHLTRGLGRLSPAGHAYRFLQYRKRFTDAELRYLTHCDFVDHLALIFAILDADGREIDQVGVARCIRTREDPQLAEVAIVVVDEWQQRGGGGALLRHLSRLAWESGIRRWQAFSLSNNTTASKIFAAVGQEIFRHPIGAGAEETIYELHPPRRAFGGGHTTGWRSKDDLERA